LEPKTAATLGQQAAHLLNCIVRGQQDDYLPVKKVMGLVEGLVEAVTETLAQFNIPQRQAHAAVLARFQAKMEKLSQTFPVFITAQEAQSTMETNGEDKDHEHTTASDSGVPELVGD
jgi:hypothetical protein